MFVLCKDVKIYNFQTHYNYQGGQRKASSIKKRQIQVIANHSNHTPFRTKGITISRRFHLNEQPQNLREAQNNNSRRNTMQQIISKEYTLQKTKRNNGNPRCMHSLQLKDNRPLLGNSLDNKKTTHERYSYESKENRLKKTTHEKLKDSSKSIISNSVFNKNTNHQRQQSLQLNTDTNINFNVMTQSKVFKQTLLNKPILSNTLQVTRKLSSTTNNTQNQRLLVTAQMKQQMIQKSSISIQQNQHQNRSYVGQNFQQDINFKNYNNNKSIKSFQNKKGTINFDINIIPAVGKDQKSLISSIHSNYRHNSSYLSRLPGNFRNKMHNQMKRVQSNQKLQSIDLSHIQMNDTKDFIIQQSFVKQHQTKNNFRQIGKRISISNRDYDETLAVETQINIIVSLKIYKEDKAEIISRELRNYQHCGCHSNIIGLYQHNFDKSQHILIKEPYTKRLIDCQNFNNNEQKLKINKSISQCKNRDSEIKYIVDCIKNALQFLQAKGIWMNWLDIQDIRQVNGIYKLFNLQNSVLNVENFVSIEENIVSLKNKIQQIWK